MPLDDDSHLMYSLAITCFRLFQGGAGGSLVPQWRRVLVCRWVWLRNVGVTRMMVEVLLEVVFPEKKTTCSQKKDNPLEKHIVLKATL